jgi:ubiquinone biosynthesis protein UbiJ
MSNFLILLAAAADPFANFADVVIGWGQVATALAAISVVVGFVFRRVVLKPLDRKIAEATKQIQPNANGGESLADVNKKVDDLTSTINQIDKRLDQIEERNSEMFMHLLNLSARLPSPRRRKKADEEEASTE